MERKQGVTTFGERNGDVPGAPEELQASFCKARDYVNTYFEKKVESHTRGPVEISGERYIQIRAATRSVDLFELILSLYSDHEDEKAKKSAGGLLFDIAHTLGKSDAKRFQEKMPIKDTMTKLFAGFHHFSYSGWAVFNISPESHPSENDSFFLSFDHPDSFEAEGWLKSGKKADFPICFMHAGYPAGWCGESMGIPLWAVEVECRAKGDESCRFIMAPPSKIETHLYRYRNQSQSDQKKHWTFFLPDAFYQEREVKDLKEKKKKKGANEKRARTDLSRTKERTDREREESREREKLFETLFNKSPAGLYIAQDNKFQFVNSQFLEFTGFKEEELLGEDSRSLILPDDRSDVRENAIRMLKGERTSPFEFRTVTKSGERRWIEQTITSVQHRRRKAVLGYFMNITERKQSERERNELQSLLYQAQKLEAIGTLAGGMAHDFNNLLMGIQGNASLMLVDVDPSHPHYTKLRNIEQQVESGSILTKQLLGYARKGRYEVKRINLNTLVEGTSNTFGRTKKGIAIQKDLELGLLATVADAGQIEQVLLNLYVNAADAMPVNGKLTLKTANVNYEAMRGKQYNPKPGNYVSLRVTDTGMGMDKKTMERIFDPFFTTKEMGRGAGLGMASVYGIIKAHGGYIDVESKRGQGSSFTIYLPASTGSVEKEIAEDEPSSKRTGTILLVDDEDMVVQVGQDMLRALGYDVIVARSGKEAVAVYRQKMDRVSLVILDMIMPDMGGAETFDILKSMNKDIRVVLTSGYSIRGKATEIINRGCNGFLQKPFTLKELSKTTEKALVERLH